MTWEHVITVAVCLIFTLGVVLIWNERRPK